MRMIPACSLSFQCVLPMTSIAGSPWLEKVLHNFGFFFCRVRNLLIENASHDDHSGCIIERTP